MNAELEACLVLHESQDFWQQRVERSAGKLRNWIEMGKSSVLLFRGRVLPCLVTTTGNAGHTVFRTSCELEDDRCGSLAASCVVYFCTVGVPL